ncbi:hypothetical protein C8R45DRAFT_1077558 [Mycena sanguinolenta]|nr:hypothetical protein C8R45DRAFT_1077558 [Mycena sanguinolenta]
MSPCPTLPLQNATLPQDFRTNFWPDINFSSHLIQAPRVAEPATPSSRKQIWVVVKFLASLPRAVYVEHPDDTFGDFLNLRIENISKAAAGDSDKIMGAFCHVLTVDQKKYDAEDVYEIEKTSASAFQDDIDGMIVKQTMVAAAAAGSEVSVKTQIRSLCRALNLFILLLIVPPAIDWFTAWTELWEFFISHCLETFLFRFWASFALRKVGVFPGIPDP